MFLVDVYLEKSAKQERFTENASLDIVVYLFMNQAEASYLQHLIYGIITMFHNLRDLLPYHVYGKQLLNKE